MIRATVFTLLALLLAPGPPASAAPPLEGSTLAGERFELPQRRGRVVLLFFWDSGCSVCLSKLPELRANAQGWAGRPFDLVTVNVDPSRAPALAYEQARRVTRAGMPIALWGGDLRLPPELARPARLPLTLVIDREGREAMRVEGRVPAALWDDIAALLP